MTDQENFGRRWRVHPLFGLAPVLALLLACTDVPDDTAPAQDAVSEPAAPPDSAAGMENKFGGIVGLERPAAEFEVLEACLSEEQKALVGQPVSAARAILPSSARILGPDDIYTQDYRPQRINADYNAGGTITRMWCG